MSTNAQRIAVVTGGSAGIGAAICRQLLEAGYQVVSISRRRPEGPLRGLHHYEADLADLNQTRNVAGDIAAQFAVTNLVHNAGVIRPALLEQVELTDLEHLTKLHLGAAIVLAQAFLPAMKAAQFGRIVCISSRAALGLPTRTAYAATKSGLIGLTRTWALELAPHGITVNAVAPGPIETDMFHEIIPADSPKKEGLRASIPRRRLGTPDDVARAVHFFLAPESDFITGQTLFVCGGTSVASLSL